MEEWSSEEMIKLGEFVKQHELPDGIEEELIKMVLKFATISKEYNELNEEQKKEKREDFHLLQDIFFSVGAGIAKLFVKKIKEVNEMQTEEQQQEISAETGAVATMQTVPVCPANDSLSWVPYIQFRKTLRPVLELKSGNLTNHTMSEIFHALQVVKNKARAMEIDIAVVEQSAMAIVHSKFDEITKGIWEFHLSSVEPTIEVMERFLELRSNMIKDEIGKPSPIPSTSADTGARRKQMQCIYCKSAAHTIYKCLNGFEGLNIPAKKQFLKREGRCENCFMRHPDDGCTAGSCWTCKVQHNSMLCPKNQKNL